MNEEDKYLNQMQNSSVKNIQDNFRKYSKDDLVKKLLAEIYKNTIITKSLDELMVEVKTLQITISKLSAKEI